MKKLFAAVIAIAMLFSFAAMAETLKQMIPANLVLLLQTAIPQTVLRPASVVGAAMVNMVRHEHHPEGGNTNGTI